MLGGAFSDQGPTKFTRAWNRDRAPTHRHRAFRIGQNGVLNILRRTQPDQRMRALFTFPITNRIQPKFHKMFRAGEFIARELDDFLQQEGIEHVNKLIGTLKL